MSADPLEGSERALRTRIALKYGQGRGILLDREELALVYRGLAGSLEQERDELLDHALQCMDRSCKRCNAAIKERDLVHKGDS